MRRAVTKLRFFLAFRRLWRSTQKHDREFGRRFRCPPIERLAYVLWNQPIELFEYYVEFWP